MSAARDEQAPVRIVAADPSWPDRFRAEAGSLAEVLGPWVVGPIEHVGSTAVPGLVAKPVIDMMAPVASLEASQPAIEVLVRSGFAYFPYKAHVMHWFCKPSAAFRTHHLHLVPFESPLWHDRLAFRDALIADPDLASRYADLKQQLALRHERDREAYSAAKGPFIQAALARLGRPGSDG